MKRRAKKKIIYNNKQWQQEQFECGYWPEEELKIKAKDGRACRERLLYNNRRKGQKENQNNEKWHAMIWWE